MSVIKDLKSQINAGKITFDPPTKTANRLKQELLGENNGTKATELLQKLVVEISQLQTIRISSIIRDEGHHGLGRAFDIANEQIAASLLPQIATDAKVLALRIDEIIFDAEVAGQSDRNKWNHNEGRKHNYSAKILDQHKNHIHLAVKVS